MKALIGLASFLLMFPLAAFSGETPQKPAAEKPAGDWWNRSSIELGVPYDGFLHHWEMQLAFMELKGNTNMSAIQAMARADFRKERFTNSVVYNIDKNHIDIPIWSHHTEKNKQVFHDALLFDLTPHFFAAVGGIWERNSDIYIDKRYSYYGGLGVRLNFLKANKLTAVAAYGFLREHYLDLIKFFGVDFTTRDYDTLFFDQTYRLTITEDLAFTQAFRIIYALNGTDDYNIQNGNVVVDKDEHRTLTTFKLGLEYKIGQYFFLTPSYQVNNDSMPWPNSKSTDRLVTTSFKVAF